MTQGDQSAEASPDPDNVDEEQGAEDLPADEVTSFRAVAARCMYLGQDRPDILFASKDVCRDMSRPSTRSWGRVTRIAKYLRANPRLICKFGFQRMPSQIDTYTDANFVACKRTRKSTSGGVIMFGDHCLRAWSKAQSTPAKSSAESELFAVVRGACESIGMITLLRELGISGVTTKLNMDASAALGIIERQCVSRIRHLYTDVLWLQHQQLRRVLHLNKVKGLDDVSDILTKNVPLQVLAKHLQGMRLEFRDGRAATAVELYALGDERGGAVPTSSTKPAMSMRRSEAGRWTGVGDDGVWRRERNTWRSALFTHLRVAQGPTE